MARAPRTCPVAGCDAALPPGQGCPTHPRRPRRAPEYRPSPAQRGYDTKWARNRARFLAAHPTCVDCGQGATVADHDPLTRRQLLAMGVEHPDAWERLRPRCAPCHNRRSPTQSR